MIQGKKPLPPGYPVRARRISGEWLDPAVILSGPIEHLAHIGEFYIIGQPPPGEEPYWAGRGRKSFERLAWENGFSRAGMYNRRELMPVK